MSKFTKEMITDYADKLLIGLTDEENKTLLEEFQVIEARMDLIHLEFYLIFLKFLLLIYH